jgi:hypothetical protein
MDWQLDLLLILGNHPQAKKLWFCVGREGLLEKMLAKVHGLCPRLTTLGFRNPMLALPWERGSFEDRKNTNNKKILAPGFDSKFAPFADLLLNFKDLQTIGAVFRPVPERTIEYQSTWWPEDF